VIYPYDCPECGKEFEVIKSFRDYDRVENCPDCDTISIRTIAKSQGIDKTAAADWNASSYNPAFGEHLTPKQAKKKAKKRGWAEVGTESPEKIEKHFADQRAAKRKADLDKINLDVGEVRSK
jgi:putative FmdB family regulatory protein